VVGETLVTFNFGTGTVGLTPAGRDEPMVAVCLLPGTEVAFEQKIRLGVASSIALSHETRTARFRQINKGNQHAHHDALEFPEGVTLALSWLLTGQRVRVLQLPAKPRTEQEREEQRRVEFAG
jgi:hypothetical protein